VLGLEPRASDVLDPAVPLNLSNTEIYVIFNLSICAIKFFVTSLYYVLNLQSKPAHKKVILNSAGLLCGCLWTCLMSMYGVLIFLVQGCHLSEGVSVSLF
jgi:hypothetical protein